MPVVAHRSLTHRFVCAIATALAAGATPLFAQQTDPILAKLSADATNVLVVRDVMKPIEQLLAAPATKELLRATADAQKELFGKAFSPEMLRAQIGLFAPMVPAEIVIGAPTRTADRVTRALALGVDVFGLSVLSRVKDPDEELVDKLREMAAEHLQQLDALPLQAWVRTRDARTAEQWFQFVADFVAGPGKALGIEGVAEGDRVKVRWQPLAADGVVRKALERLQVPLAKAPAAVFEATLELAGDRLSLQIGTLAAGPCAAERFGPLWAGEPLLFARTDFGDEAADLVDSYVHVVEVGTEDLTASDQANVDRLEDRLLRLATAMGDVTAAVGVGADGAWATREERFHEPPGEDIDFVPADLLRFVDAQNPFWLSSASLDTVLATTLDDAVSRAELADQFEALSDFLGGEESSVFAPGVAIVARAAAFRGAKDWKHGVMPFAALAIVVKPHTAAEGENFVRELTSHLAAGFGADAPKWEAADLGLGVPTQALQLDGLALFAKGEFDCDFRPHWFFVGGALVVSTDPQLSKELQRRAANEPAVKAPADKLCAWGRCEGTVFVDAFAGLERWARVLPELGLGLGEGPKVLGFACRVLAGLCANVERLERTSVVDGSTLRETAELRWRKAK